jgi:hypothetical protein
MIRQSFEEKNEPEGPTSSGMTWAVIFTIFCCIAILSVSLWLSFYTYEWGRSRGLQSLPLSRSPLRAVLTRDP